MVSKALPVPVDNLCVATTNRGRPCRTPREAGSDYCYRHRPRAVPVEAEKKRAPFPKLPPSEELTTAAGIRDLTAGLLRYVAENEDADLARVYAAQAMIPRLQRAMDVARLEAALSEERRAHGETSRRMRQFERELEEVRAGRETGAAELARLRAENRRLAARNAELEEKEAKRVQAQERLQAAVAQQHQERAISDQTLDDHLRRLRRVHQTLCRPCAQRIRPLIGGRPEVGDADYLGV